MSPDGHDQPRPKAPAAEGRLQQLTAVWRAVLGVADIGPHDNFFDVGGDSLTAIQVSARARQIGLDLTPRMLYEQGSIAELAAVTRTLPTTARDPGMPLAAAAPLSPMQASAMTWPFLQPTYFLLEARETVDVEQLGRALDAVVARHSSLRSRITRNETGAAWEQRVAQHVDPTEILRADWRKQSGERHIQLLQTLVDRLSTELNYQRGPLLRVAVIERGTGVSQYLLVMIHHLVIDGYSWSIVLHDVELAYRQLGELGHAELPHATTEFTKWTSLLSAYAKSPEAESDSAFWLEDPNQQTPGLTVPQRMPVDFPDGEGLPRTNRWITSALSPHETGALVAAAARIRVPISDVLLAALQQVLAKRWRGQPICVEMLVDGRAPAFRGVDLSRTVGWIATTVPLILGAAPPSLEASAKALADRMRRIPHGGVTHSAVTFLAAETPLANRLGQGFQRQVSFNFQGRKADILPKRSLFRIVHQRSLTPWRAGTNSPAPDIHVSPVIEDDELRLIWMYAEPFYRAATIETMTREYESALRRFARTG